MNLSVLLSAALAIVYARAGVLQTQAEREPQRCRLHLGWQCILVLQDLRQVLCLALLMLSASSVIGLLWAGICIRLPWDPPSRPDWFSPEEASSSQLLSLHLALLFWRAEKMEEFYQRADRSVRYLKQIGMGQCLQRAAKDPWGEVWPGFWGLSRRWSLILLSCFIGSSTFALRVFPAVVLDEFLFFAVAKFSNICSQFKINIPEVVELLVLPLLDQLHFVPVLANGALLAAYEYPMLNEDVERKVYPILCAFAWSAHNFHSLYATIFVNLWETAQQYWAMRRGGGAGQE